ncbi:MAG: HAMP domain-containing histidine kinase, partial [Anaeroplasmataceae bacterium]|nr:HAMP domain-containing histidine kinase [Anaeroplasmataceae bacterium]
ILDLSKLEEGKLAVTNERVDLKDVFQFCIDSISNLLTENKISLQTEFSVSNYLVYSDERRLNQILLNLLSNAWKYSKEGDVISFFLREDNVDETHSRYTFIIQDTGCGMSSEFQKHLFEPYAQENGNKKESTGLGLAIVKKLVDQMQGEIKVQSQLNQGTTFQVQFILEYELVEDNDFLQDLRILFVDDMVVSVELI